MLWFLLRVLAIVLGIYAAEVFAQQHTVTLHGTLFVLSDAIPPTETDCRFGFDPIGESQGIQAIEVLPEQYLCAWLQGTAAKAHGVTITIAPD